MLAWRIFLFFLKLNAAHIFIRLQLFLYLGMATKALFNTVVNWFIKQRIDQIENFIKNPIDVQNGILFSQLFHAEETEYGKKHGFNSISNYQDFKNKVPIVI